MGMGREEGEVHSPIMNVSANKIQYHVHFTMLKSWCACAYNTHTHMHKERER